MNNDLFSRVSRLISGSVNGIVDAVENAAPETVMRESIREIDKAVRQVRDELGKLLATKHHAARRLADTSSEHDTLIENTRVALTDGREDLAKAAIGRQLDLEAQIPVLEATLRDISEQEGELESYISALQARKREMEQDLRKYLADQAAAASGSSAAGGSGAGATSGNSAEAVAERAEAAFNRVMEASTGVPSDGTAQKEDAVKLAELEKLSRDNRIEERLAALKAEATS